VNSQSAGRTARPKRQHYLPIGYLKAWSDASDQVGARRRDGGPAFSVNTKNIAVEANLYSINMGDYWDDTLETALSREVEGELPDLLEALRRGRAPRRGTAQRLEIAQLVAIQHVRTPASINQALFSTLAREAIGEYPMTHTGMRAYLTGLYGRPPTDAEVQGAVDYSNFDQRQAPSKSAALEILIRLALDRIAPHLEKRAWRVEVCREARFITTDRPIALWARDVVPYTGIGLMRAHEVRFPLGPNHMLVIGRGSDERYVVDRQRAAGVNEHLTRGCRQLLIGHPEDKAPLAGLHLPVHGPAMRFNTGPARMKGLDGQLVDTGREILHMYMAVDDTV